LAEGQSGESALLLAHDSAAHLLGRKPASVRPRRALPLLGFLSAVLVLASPVGGATAFPSVVHHAPFIGSLVGANTTYYFVPCSNRSQPVGPSFNFTNGLGRWVVSARAHSCSSSGTSEVGETSTVDVEALTWVANSTQTVHVHESLVFDWSLQENVTYAGGSPVASATASWGVRLQVWCPLAYCLNWNPHISYLSNTSSIYRTTGSSTTHGVSHISLSTTVNVTKGRTYSIGFETWAMYDVEAFGSSGNRASMTLNLGSHGRHFGLQGIWIR
jgi:hypothetical protein